MRGQVFALSAIGVLLLAGIANAQHSIQVLTVEAYGAPKAPSVTSAPLELGKEYIIQTTGTVIYYIDVGLQADAEWFQDLDGTWIRYTPTGAPFPDILDLLINEQAVDWLGSTDGNEWVPNRFSPTHVYRYEFTAIDSDGDGQGDPVTFRFEDSVHCGDNSGSLQVEILRKCPCSRFTTSAFGEPMGKKKQLGSTLPVKFQLFFDDDDDPLTPPIEVAGQEQLNQILTQNGCQADSPHIVIQDISESVNIDLPEDQGNVGEGGDLGDSFRYSDGIWIFNLGLPNDIFYSGREYKVSITIGACVLTPGNDLFEIK